VGRVNCVTFHPTDTNTLWIGTPNGGIWKSTDNGGSWIPLNEGLIELGVSDLVVNPQDPDEMYVATGDFDYFFIFLNAQRPAGSEFSNVGGNGIYKTTDGGLSWNATGYNFSLPMGRGALVRRILVHPRHPDTLLAGGVDGIWRSEDGGDSWNQVVSDIVTDLEFHPSEPGPGVCCQQLALGCKFSGRGAPVY
jgi:xyloglucan-specific exo-beta-1,4-glucanase